MGNSAGMSISKQGNPDQKPKQSFVGITELLNKEIQRIETTLQSHEAIDEFIKAIHNDSVHGEGPASNGDEKTNITQSVISTMDKICSSLMKIRSRIERLQATLKQFDQTVSERCEVLILDEKTDILDKVKLHLDLTTSKVANTCSRILPAELSNSNSDSTNVHDNEFSDAGRERYINEISQLKQITDTLEDELVSLKQENTNKNQDMEATNMRMQKLEEKVLEERMSHEVEVNALKAVIEKQEGIINSLNGDMVNNSWLENQKSNLFSKRKEDDEISNDTCFDLIYVDQKTLSCNRENRTHTPDEITTQQETDTKEHISYDTCSMASTRYVTDDDVPLPANVSEEPESEITQALDTPSDVILSFKKGDQSELDDSDNKTLSTENTHSIQDIVVKGTQKEVSNTKRNSNTGINEKKYTREIQHEAKVETKKMNGNKADINKENYRYENLNIDQFDQHDTALNSNQNNAPPPHTDYETTKNTQSVFKLKEVDSLKSGSSDTGDNKTVDMVPVKESILESEQVNSSSKENSLVDQSYESSNKEKPIKEVKEKHASTDTLKETLPDSPEHHIESNQTKIEIATQKTNLTEQMLEDVKEEKQEDILVYEDSTTKEIMYKRNDGEIDGSLTYYKGVGAIIRTTLHDFGVASVQCVVTDAVRNDMLPDLVEGERPISFFIHIKRPFGENHMAIQETDSVQVFVPHQLIPVHEEATLVCSINGQDWEQCDLIQELPASLAEEVHVLGTELRDIDDVKLVAIAREKTVQIMAGEDDILYQSLMDPGIRVKINTECFPVRCCVTFTVHQRHKGALQTAAQIHTECRQIMSCTAFVSLVCERVATEDIHVLMNLPPGADEECKYTLFLLEESSWKLADCDWDKSSHVLTVHLTAGMRIYRVIGLELPNDMSVEERLLAAQFLHRHTSHHSVQIVFRQKEADPSVAIVLCTLTNTVERAIVQLRESGYSIGGPPSEPFCIQDGSALVIECTGDIIATPHKSTKMEMIFHSQKEIASKQLNLCPTNTDVRSKTAKMCQGTLHVIRGPRPGFVVLAETIHIPTTETKSK